MPDAAGRYSLEEIAIICNHCEAVKQSAADAQQQLMQLTDEHSKQAMRGQIHYWDKVISAMNYAISLAKQNKAK